MEIVEKPFEMSESNFKSYTFGADVSELHINYRILKMDSSLLIYIGTKDNEVFDEIALGMMTENGEVISTTIMGELIGCGSEQLAKKIVKRLKKQVYVSCNVPEDRLSRPCIEKYLIEKIKSNPEMF